MGIFPGLRSGGEAGTVPRRQALNPFYFLIYLWKNKKYRHVSGAASAPAGEVRQTMKSFVNSCCYIVKTTEVPTSVAGNVCVQ